MQGLVEHGALTGGQAAGASPRGPGGRSLIALATENWLVLVAVLDILLLLGLVRTADRR